MLINLLAGLDGPELIAAFSGALLFTLVQHTFPGNKPAHHFSGLIRHGRGWRRYNPVALRRHGSVLRGVIVYFLIILCAAVTIRTLIGEYYFADWSEAVINAALCLFCLLSGGNLFQRVRNENR